MKKEAIITIKKITKKFKDREVLKNINLAINEGTIVGIIGRNGSGKTVLLKIISGLYFETTGEINRSTKYNIYEDYGFLIDVGFLDNETGFNNLKILSLLKNKINDNEIIEILKYVGLNPFDKTKYRNYSTGMKQKLKIAQALMEKPKVLILDEPFNGLDKKSVDFFRKEFLRLKSLGTTIIITSHYQEDIDKLCDVVYEMVDGELEKYEKEIKK